jgi:hypothetical protein
MAAIGNTISSDLAAQIQLLSTIKDDSNLDPADKQAKLRQEGEKTLAMIAKEKGSLSIVNSAFASNIQDVIQVALASDDWDGIPQPIEMKREIADLKQVSQALAISLSQGFNDANDILKLLMDINSKIQTSNAKEWLTHIKNTMEAANEQFRKTEISIKTQNTADRTAAIGQIVGGSLSCAMSAGSMVGSWVSAKKQLSALKTQKTMHGMEDGLEAMAAKSKQASKDVGEQKAQLERMKTAKTFSPEEIAAQDKKLTNTAVVRLEVDKQHHNAKTAYRDIKYNTERISIKNQTLTAHMNSLGGLGNGTNALANGTAGVMAADQRAEASLAKLEADKSEYLRSFEQNMGQNAFDRYQKTGQFIDKALQALTNMWQNHSGVISTINNKV